MSYDNWKTTNPADAQFDDYEDYDPRNDPVVQLEMTTSELVSAAEAIVAFTSRDRIMVYGVLPDIHAAWTMLGLVLDQYQKLPQAAE